jgi:hypothetical protein
MAFAICSGNDNILRFSGKLSLLESGEVVCLPVLLASRIDLDRQTPMFLPYGLRER